MNRIALVLTLSLAACGTENIDSANDESFVAASNDALEESSMTLTDAKKADFVEMYKEISGYTEDNVAPTFAVDMAVAVIDVTGAIPNIRIRGTREASIPAGTVTAPRDPSFARQFYVAMHDKDVSTVYGPFTVTGRAGAQCGSYIGGALPPCGKGLACEGGGGGDQSGTCRVSSEQN